MLGSIAGLLVLGVVLIPGNAYNLTRRRIVPMGRASRVMETVQVVVTAFVFTAMSLALFGSLRHVSWIGDNSPDPSCLIRAPRDYLLADDTRLLWVLAWAALVTLAAVLLAWLAAHRVWMHLWLPDKILKRIAPVVIDAPAWHRVFHDEVPEKAAVYVACEMHNGGYIGGQLSWYSTETEETPDREIVLAPPFFRTKPDGDIDENLASRTQQLVVSAREIRTIQVTYVNLDPDDPPRAQTGS